MVVVDSSAIIPLAWVGQLDLITDVIDRVDTTEHIREESTIEGKPGSAALRTFLEAATVHATPDDAESIAELEGIARGDASVLLLAIERSDVLLANDKALIEVARTNGVDCFWITTLLLEATKDGVRSPDESAEILYELVVEGMNLHPRIYSKVQRALQEIEF